MSHWTPARHADESQSGRPCSTSSTNWYLSDGRLRRNASFSSGELTVMVQTVAFAAYTGIAANGSARRARITVVLKRMAGDESGYRPRHCTSAPPPWPSVAGGKPHQGSAGWG